MTEASSDLFADCASEPIHVPGSIMPFGMLLSLDAARITLLRASANAAPLLACRVEDALGRPLHEVAAPELAEVLRAVRGVTSRLPEDMGRVVLAGCPHVVTLFASGDEWVLEVEEPTEDEPSNADDLYEEVRLLAEAIHGLETVEGMCEAAARSVSRLVGFDRALVYRFERNWDGVVVAEIVNGRLPSYAGLRFPAHDIPAQARALYTTNRFRQIPDADYGPVPILGRTVAALDLSLSVLRSVSPVHLEYMRNMGTAASMSISIVVEDRLWGLISCHNVAPRRVSAVARSACTFVGQLVALGIGGHLRYAEAAERVRRQRIQAQLLAAMASRPRFMDGLLIDGDNLLALEEADGAAVLADGACVRVGATPPEAVIRRIAGWLAQRGEDDVVATDHLGAVMPSLETMADLAAGVLAISISQIHPSYVLWFRGEWVRSVHWAGEPHAADIKDGPAGGQRISPRRSFETWKETVRGRSRPWAEADLEAARDMRGAIVNIVLRRAEQMADISRELERSNKELEAFSYSISHDLRAPFRHIVGYAELLRERDFPRMDEKSRHYVETIIDSAFSAGKLVDDLLRFSQMGRMTIQRVPVSTSKLVEEVIRSVQPDIGERHVTFDVGDLPAVQGDPSLLRQVFHNLISNAVKYTRGRDPAVIGVAARRDAEETVFSVSDNGVGFDQAYVGKLFGVFQRLHRVEEFEGTGIGLANVRRIVERHGGRVAAEGRLGEGAVFTFALPQTEAPTP
jgi:light-regulated signal transduction histidine kinase (bacteriophytochrome)